MSPYMSLYVKGLIHLPLVLHICVSESISIGLDKGLSPIRRQAFI